MFVILWVTTKEAIQSRSQNNDLNDNSEPCMFISIIKMSHSLQWFMFFILRLSLLLTPGVTKSNPGHSSKGWETLVWTSNSCKFISKINPYVPWIRNIPYVWDNIRDMLSDLLSTDIFTVLIYLSKVMQWDWIYNQAFNSFMQAFTMTLTPMEPIHQNEQNKNSCLSTKQRKPANESVCAELGSHTQK